MTLTRKKWSLCFAIVIVATVTFLVVRYLNEPRYQGKTLSYWIESVQLDMAQRKLNSSTSESSPAVDNLQSAVLKIGTDAIPYLMRELSYESPKWAEYVPAFVWRSRLIRYPDRYAHSFPALVGFWALGTNAQIVLPELERLLNHPQHTSTAARILRHSGDNTFHVITNALTNIAVEVRLEVVTYTGSYGDTNGIAAVALRCLNDPEAVIRRKALELMRKGAVPSDVLIGKLIAALKDPEQGVRLEAMKQLAKSTVEATSALPELKGFLNHADSETRIQAQATIDQIEAGPSHVIR